MDKDMQQELLKRLDVLSDKLGMGSSHLWNLMLLQMKVELAKDIVFVFMILLLSGPILWWWKIAYERMKKINEVRDNANKLSFGGFLYNKYDGAFPLFGVSIIYLLIFIFGIPTLIFGIMDLAFNPQLEAVKEIMQLVR